MDTYAKMHRYIIFIKHLYFQYLCVTFELTVILFSRYIAYKDTTWHIYFRYSRDK